jgi:hypothetical protein
MHKPTEEKQVILGQMQLQASVAMQLLTTPATMVLTVEENGRQKIAPLSNIERQARTEAARFIRDLLKQRPGM